MCLVFSVWCLASCDNPLNTKYQTLNTKHWDDEHETTGD